MLYISKWICSHIFAICLFSVNVVVVVVVVALPQALRMFPETLDLRVNGGRDNHSWCMCVVSNGYGVFGWGMDGSGG